MSLSSKIFLALGLGIATGLFFGEMVTFLKVPADIFILLLQMTVLPYVILSLIVGFGSLSFADAKLLAIKGTAVILLLWGMAFIVLLLMPLAFPSWETGSFFSAAMVESKQAVNYYEIFIPANPFYSMSRNLVPAVVIFSISLGVALIGVKDKALLLNSFSVFKEALTKVTSFMVSLMPIGIFAIAANAAGTMNIAEFDRLQVYLILYIAISLLFTFWILPGLVAALTPIKYREILSLSKDAMVTAFMTATLLVVLPMLVENCKTLLIRHKLATERSKSVLDAAIPASFNFPQTGKILAMSFILFAAWFTDNPVTLAEYPLLMLSSLASFFGSLNVAIPFLLDLQQIPADMFQLFIVSGVLNSRFGTLLAAMHTLVLGILVASAVIGGLTINIKKLINFTIITGILTAATIGGTKLLFTYGISHTYDKDKIISAMQLLQPPPHVSAKVYKKPPSSPASADPIEYTKLQAIQARGVLRVAYITNNLPFSFFNTSGKLVGFDIDMAYKLAKDLGVSLEFLPVTHDNLAQQLAANYCDIVMAGIVISTQRATKMSFSDAYLNDTLGFIVKDHRRHDFDNSESRAALENVVIADYTHIPQYSNIIRRYFAQAKIEPINNIDDFFNDKYPDVDAVLATVQRGSAYSLLHPDYTVVLPRPILISLPLAYPMANKSTEFNQFINTWINLQKMDGTIVTFYDYWVLGKNASPVKPRWSVIRDVLHWVD